MCRRRHEVALAWATYLITFSDVIHQYVPQYEDVWELAFTFAGSHPARAPYPARAAMTAKREVGPLDTSVPHGLFVTCDLEVLMNSGLDFALQYQTPFEGCDAYSTCCMHLWLGSHELGSSCYSCAPCIIYLMNLVKS